MKYFICFGLILSALISKADIFVDGKDILQTTTLIHNQEVNRALAAESAISNANLTFADSLTMKKVNKTFSVADWIPRNLVDVYVQSLVKWGAAGRGMIDGAGYTFSDENGILAGLSTNYVFDVSGYRNIIGSTNIPSTNGLSTPIAHYKMNDNAGNTTVIDSIGGNSSTAQQNTSSLHVIGKINGALSFNGASDFISTSFQPAVTNGQFTLLTWVKTSYSGGGCFLAFGAEGALQGVGLQYTTWSDQFAVEDATDQIVSDITANDGNWHHVGLSYNGSSALLYVDGVLSIKSSSIGYTNRTYNISTGNIGLGYRPYYGGSSYFNGYLDDTRIYTKALSSNEIIAIYNAGNGTEEIGSDTTLYTTNSMSLVCTNKVLDFVPTATWMSILCSGSGITTNDIQGSVSPDYGANWYQATLVPSASIDMSNTLFSGYAYYTNNLTGTNMILRAVTSSNKVTKVLGIYGPSN